MATVSDVPPNELEILETLIALRQQLSVMKRDRTQFIDSADVVQVYEKLVEQVSRINKIRDEPVHKGEQNRVDALLDDIFQLLSLFYLAIGRNNSTPACYVQISTVQRILDHLNESGYFTENDLAPIRMRLDEMSRIIEQEKESSPPDLYKLFLTKLQTCEEAFARSRGRLSRLSPDIIPVQQKLVSIRRQLSALASRTRFDAEQSNDLNNLQNELRKIESMRSAEGQFVDSDGKPLEGQDICNALLEELFNFAQDLSSRKGISEVILNDIALRGIYDRLSDLKSQLERLSLTHRWTLRETDLYMYQTRLSEIDELRVDGKFLDSNKEPRKEQSVGIHTHWSTKLIRQILLYMMRRCYAIIYQLLSASEPVSEALTPIHNQLKTVRRCLIEVKKSGGPYSARELYPYQMKLASIDNMRKDGKFTGDKGTIPEGQGAVHALLEECYDYIAELHSLTD